MVWSRQRNTNLTYYPNDSNNNSSQSHTLPSPTNQRLSQDLAKSVSVRALTGQQIDR